MNDDKLELLKIRSEAKQRPKVSTWTILAAVVAIVAASLYFAWPRASDNIRVWKSRNQTTTNAAQAAPASSSKTSDTIVPAPVGTASAGPAQRIAESVLTVSGYIINRERIELSPRFMGVVKWIGVKKGDMVTNGQVVVLLDDAEYKARLAETDGRLSNAKVGVEKAQLDFQRVKRLSTDNVESKQAEDNARLAVESAKATVKEIEGQIALITTYLDWCTIRSHIDGVVLEKLVDPNELVTPQSFGGTRGPSTALVALADPKDLQVEIDLNEADLSKVFLKQPCKISPEAYPDRIYDGYVVEIAPEANRQKGTLQVKVQIKDPDRFLTPELSARVDFIGKAR